MKKVKKTLAITMVAMQIAAVSPVTFAANSGNIIKNPGFRYWTNTAAFPLKWTGSVGFNTLNFIVNDAAVTFRSGNEAGKTGNDVLKMVGGTSSTVKPVISDLDKTVVPVEGDTYKLRMFVRVPASVGLFHTKVGTTVVGHMTLLDPEKYAGTEQPTTTVAERIAINTWVESATFYKQPVTTPPTVPATGTSIAIKNLQNGTTVFVDNVGLYHVDLNNPVFNQSFEKNIDSSNPDLDVATENFEHWGWENVPACFTLDETGTNAHTGNISVKAVGDAGKSFQQIVAAKANADYTLEFYSKGAAGVTVSVSNKATPSTALASVVTQASDGWVKNSVKIPADSVERKIVKVASSSTTGAVTYLDDVRLAVEPYTLSTATFFESAAPVTPLTQLKAGTITCKAVLNYHNLSQEAAHPVTVISAYYEDGKLFGLSTDIKDVSTDGDYNFTTEFPLVSQTQYKLTAKVFVWDSISTLCPLTQIKNFPA